MYLIYLIYLICPTCATCSPHVKKRSGEPGSMASRWDLPSCIPSSELVPRERKDRRTCPSAAQVTICQHPPINKMAHVCRARIETGTSENKPKQKKHTNTNQNEANKKQTNKQEGHAAQEEGQPDVTIRRTGDIWTHPTTKKRKAYVFKTGKPTGKKSKQNTYTLAYTTHTKQNKARLNKKMCTQQTRTNKI